MMRQCTGHTVIGAHPARADVLVEDRRLYREVLGMEQKRCPDAVAVLVIDIGKGLATRHVQNIVTGEAAIARHLHVRNGLTPSIQPLVCM